LNTCHWLAPIWAASRATHQSIPSVQGGVVRDPL
jgi:hypothetical protein